MALNSYGPDLRAADRRNRGPGRLGGIQLWPCIVMALYSYGRDRGLGRLT